MGVKAHFFCTAGRLAGSLAVLWAALPTWLSAAAETPADTASKASSEHESAYAWQSTDEYTPPDFARFFPDDREGGQRLDTLWDSTGKDSRSDEEILSTVRRGLRCTSKHRTLILAWIGNRYIWGKSPQDAEAIEIMYHAADFSGPRADPFGTRHYAVYFGLSVVRPKTPAILRTLAELCMRVDDPNDLSRVAWGTKPQREEILAYLQPYCEAEDDAVRTKAEVVKKILRGEIEAFQWAQEKATQRAREKFSDKLPEIKRALLEGDSRQRRDTLTLIEREGIALIMDDSFIPALAACATDEQATIRNSVARLVGGRWIGSAKTQNSDAIDLVLRLSHDRDRQVRYNAVYFGISTVRNKDEEIVRRLLEMAFDDREWNLYQRITWGLRGSRDTAARLLEAYITGDDPARAKAAREVYKDVGGREPPGSANDSALGVRKPRKPSLQNGSPK